MKNHTLKNHTLTLDIDLQDALDLALVFAKATDSAYSQSEAQRLRNLARRVNEAILDTQQQALNKPTT